MSAPLTPPVLAPDEGYIEEDLAIRIELPSVERKDIDVLTDEELAQILQRLPLIDDQGRRNCRRISRGQSRLAAQRSRRAQR